MWPTVAMAQATDAPLSPLAGDGVRSVHLAHTAEERAELDDLESTVQRFERQAAEYRATTRQLIEYKYQQKRATLHQSYERIIEDLESEQRRRRDDAIAKFEAFIRSYPGDAFYTSDAMFRLSELYFERSYDIYFQARQQYDKAVEAWSPQAGGPEPIEPELHYEPTIAMMQRLITEYPNYRLVDGAYYLLGYCLGEQSEDERAVEVYEELVSRFPTSRFAAEVWTRIGEYYFDSNELARALMAYSQVLGHVDSPFYDKAMYKLAWTHYRLADPERAPEEFQKAVDTFVELLDFHEKTKAEGHPRGGDLRAESLQYIAICYADEQWGSLEKLETYLAKMGERAYSHDLMLALGDVYFDQTRYEPAIAAYRLVQQRYPGAPDAPQTQEKIVTAHERNRDFAGAADARAQLTQTYSEGTTWHTANQASPDAIALAEDLIKKALYSAALFHHKQAQVHKEAQKIDLAKAEYEKAAAAYGEYLRRFPHDKQLYELQFYYAECLYYSLQFEPAALEYAKVRDSNADNKFASGPLKGKYKD
ncbi:MAG: tetratricopeptide repeat protein, partial [Myxococcota bacterium]